MRRFRVVAAVVVAGALTLALCGCSIDKPIAFRISDDTFDIAFCDAFDATRVEMDFGDYPPPFMGSLESIAVVSISGPAARFGDGVPVSVSSEGWTAAADSDVMPDEWDRVDYSFYDARGEYINGEYLMRDEAKSADWGWREGSGVSEPQCELDAT